MLIHHFSEEGAPIYDAISHVAANVVFNEEIQVVQQQVLQIQTEEPQADQQQVPQTQFEGPQAEEDFELEEEEWWGSVTVLCNETDEVDDGIESEEDLTSLCSDDEDTTLKKYSIEYNPKTKWEDFKYVTNESDRVRAICKCDGCPWMVYAHVLSDKRTFRVNSLWETHECPLMLNNKKADSSWLANYFLERFRLNPNMDFKAFREITQDTKFSMVHVTKRIERPPSNNPSDETIKRRRRRQKQQLREEGASAGVAGPSFYVS
ncbi:hypothetical protein G4B88_011593 [Cannabis sativa]|uniref:Transposase MuDR plant domain-containing protein n=1 Tax=Cannabis sativa TaxID=3483 RepID=A0A7J6GH75_CANSA|nr:hypothetical protein G4B88_011593 [Cannabis sativa]